MGSKAFTIDIESLQNRLLKVCYVPPTSASLPRLLFLLHPLTVLMKQTRQAVFAIKQYLLLRCLWYVQTLSLRRHFQGILQAFLRHFNQHFLECSLANFANTKTSFTMTLNILYRHLYPVSAVDGCEPLTQLIALSTTLLPLASKPLKVVASHIKLRHSAVQFRVHGNSGDLD